MVSTTSKKHPSYDIWLLSDRCLSGFGDFEGNDHGKGLMENLWLNFRCRSQKKEHYVPFKFEKLCILLFCLTGNPCLMQKNFELYMPVDFQHIP